MKMAAVYEHQTINKFLEKYKSSAGKEITGRL
jgi:hypothetical protein